MVPSGTVVLAATPIGNVGDASDRLKALLADADIVAAEDTRRLYDLANRLGVHVNGTVIAYHDHNERDKADGCSTVWRPAPPCWWYPTRACDHQRSRTGDRAPGHRAWAAGHVRARTERRARRARALRPADRPVLL